MDYGDLMRWLICKEELLVGLWYMELKSAMILKSILDPMLSLHVEDSTTFGVMEQTLFGSLEELVEEVTQPMISGDIQSALILGPNFPLRQFLMVGMELLNGIFKQLTLSTFLVELRE